MVQRLTERTSAESTAAASLWTLTRHARALQTDRAHSLDASAGSCARDFQPDPGSTRVVKPCITPPQAASGRRRSSSESPRRVRSVPRRLIRLPLERRHRSSASRSRAPPRPHAVRTSTVLPQAPNHPQAAGSCPQLLQSVPPTIALNAPELSRRLISFSLVSRTGKPITTVDEWRDELNKREQSKFVPGYSAYETARAWTEPNRVPAEIKALFRLPPLEGSGSSGPSSSRRRGSTSTAARAITTSSLPCGTPQVASPSSASNRR